MSIWLIFVIHPSIFWLYEILCCYPNDLHVCKLVFYYIDPHYSE